MAQEVEVCHLITGQVVHLGLGVMALEYQGNTQYI